MQVIKLEEHGYNSALYGFSLSYKDRAIPRDEWWWFPEHVSMYSQKASWPVKEKRLNQIIKTATANAGRGKGHDKFLRQIQVWLDVEAPRYWWSEFDTYKVGTVAQSESTMHTLSRRDITYGDFASGMSVTFNLDQFNQMRKAEYHITSLKGALPESYLQRRVATLNYAVLRCIIEQRKNHKLPEWHTFIDAIYNQMDHPELLPKRG